MGAVPRGWASVPRLRGSLAPQLHWDLALVQMVHLQSLSEVKFCLEGRKDMFPRSPKAMAMLTLSCLF